MKTMKTGLMFFHCFSVYERYIIMIHKNIVWRGLLSGLQKMLVAQPPSIAHVFAHPVFISCPPPSAVPSARLD